MVDDLPGVKLRNHSLVSRSPSGWATIQGLAVAQTARENGTHLTTSNYCVSG